MNSARRVTPRPTLKALLLPLLAAVTERYERTDRDGIAERSPVYIDPPTCVGDQTFFPNLDGTSIQNSFSTISVTTQVRINRTASAKAGPEKQPPVMIRLVDEPPSTPTTALPNFWAIYNFLETSKCRVVGPHT